jgi:hypothetical protein
MRFIYIIIIFISFSLQAQKEFGKSSKSFPMLYKPKPLAPPVEIKPENKSPFSDSDKYANEKPLFTPSNNFEEKKVSTTYQIKDKKEISLTPEDKFLNPHEDVLRKLNQKGNGEVSASFKLVRGNQDLGVFATKSKFATIRFRDFGEVDGDEIRIYINGKIEVERVQLEFGYKILKIELIKGFNKIDFEALNQGTVGPNTADFKVTDDNGNVVSSDLWNLATGFKASITIVKE